MLLVRAASSSIQEIAGDVDRALIDTRVPIEGSVSGPGAEVDAAGAGRGPLEPRDGVLAGARAATPRARCWFRSSSDSQSVGHPDRRRQAGRPASSPPRTRACSSRSRRRAAMRAHRHVGRRGPPAPQHRGVRAGAPPLGARAARRDPPGARRPADAALIGAARRGPGAAAAVGARGRPADRHRDRQPALADRRAAPAGARRDRARARRSRPSPSGWRPPRA